LKKWLSARSALQESPKTSLKHYENDVFGLRTGGTRERDGVFQHAGKLSAWKEYSQKSLCRTVHRAPVLRRIRPLLTLKAQNSNY
jgi:hypothetical protein